jgi:phospholipase/lecithinase/hemolysin
MLVLTNNTITMINNIYNSKNSSICVSGFAETKKGCCGTGTIEWGPMCNFLSPVCSNPSQYMFFDVFHPTQAGYKILADEFIKTVLPNFAT